MSMATSVWTDSSTSVNPEQKYCCEKSTQSVLQDLSCSLSSSMYSPALTPHIRKSLRRHLHLSSVLTDSAYRTTDSCNYVSSDVTTDVESSKSCNLINTTAESCNHKSFCGSNDDSYNYMCYSTADSSYIVPDGSSLDSAYCSTWSSEVDNTVKDRPPCIGQEDSPIRKSTRSRRSLSRSHRRSVKKSQLEAFCLNSNITKSNMSTDSHNNTSASDETDESSNTTSHRSKSHLDFINVSLTSDSSSFMDKPLCHLGVTEQTMSKERKKSLVHKLKKIGKQFHKKCSGGNVDLKTLAVL